MTSLPAQFNSCVFFRQAASTERFPLSFRDLPGFQNLAGLV